MTVIDPFTRSKIYQRLPAALPCAPEPVADALTRYHQALTDQTAADRALKDLQQSERAAHLEDVRATAEALAAGRKDPGGRHVAEHARKVADATRVLAARQQLTEQADQTLRAAIRAHGLAWRRRLADARAANRAQVTETLDHLEGLLRERQELTATTGFVTSGFHKFRPGILLPADGNSPLAVLRAELAAGDPDPDLPAPEEETGDHAA